MPAPGLAKRRYVARPAIALERLSRDGLVVDELEHAFRDGRTARAPPPVRL